MYSLIWKYKVAGAFSGVGLEEGIEEITPQYGLRMMLPVEKAADEINEKTDVEPEPELNSFRLFQFFMR